MLYDKRMLYETDIRVPLFVRGAARSVAIRALTPRSAHRIKIMAVGAPCDEATLRKMLACGRAATAGQTKYSRA